MGLSATASQVPIYSRTSKMSGLVFENYWQNKAACEDAERAYYMKLSGCKVTGSLSEQIARARDHIKNSLNSVDNLTSGLSASEEMALVQKLGALEVENKQLKKVTDDLKALVLSLQARVETLEGGKPSSSPAKSAPAPAEDDDEDDEEKKRITEERLKAYNEKKAKKPKVIAKTSVLFDVKPWDDETDMEAMKEACKSIEMEGLVW